MSASSSSSEVSLKLLIDTKAKKVLFAEANKPFSTRPRWWSLGKLYESIENLSDTYMQPNRSKKSSVLNPKTVKYGAYVPLLLPPNDHNIPMAQKFYRCNSSCYSNLTFVGGGGMLNGMAEGGGFVKGVVTYMVSDDLVVKPMSTISSITMLNKFNVKEVGCLEEKVVSLEMKEGLMLLKASFQSKNVLTSVFLE
uniref:Uncharacterized protein n=1 Tax=Lactuca sativa TaxID=4236 RepID=A0A9R1WD42_LACSA|nr:hypothetical protein LSAT_V11C200093160 [Lactuca sativa]